jgi:hypothetical protein
MHAAQPVGLGIERGRAHCQRAAFVQPGLGRHVQAELSPHRRHSVGDEFKRARIDEWPDGVKHGGHSTCRGDEWGSERVWVEHQQARLGLLAQVEQVVEHQRHTDLAEQPGHEVAGDPRRMKSIARPTACTRP